MMERTKLTNNQKMYVNSELTNRALLAGVLGLQSYGGTRDIYNALGYPTELVFRDFFTRYVRQDIAKAVIDRPVSKTWSGDLELLEADDDKETQFERQWKDLNKQFSIKSIFSRLDKLTGLGKYGVLLLGLDDVKQTSDYALPVKAGKRSLIYLKPLSQQSAQIVQTVSDPSDKRYGMPLIYQVTIGGQVSNRESISINVHYTRVIHVVDDLLESDVEGLPRLEVVFNRLMDIEKIVGGDGEMFWRGARPGYTGSLKDGYTMTDKAKKDFNAQIDEYEHNLRRFLINEGIDTKALEQQLADPTTHLDAQIQMISAVTHIPKRILTGSERGELSSGQDADEWRSYIEERRLEYAEPRIIRPFVQTMINYGIMTKPVKDYSVKWSDLFALGKKDKADIGKVRADALKAYYENPAVETVVPPDAFMEFFLGLNSDEIDLINEMRDKAVNEEQPLSQEEQNTLDELEQPVTLNK